jgi:hypothetical protein
MPISAHLQLALLNVLAQNPPPPPAPSGIPDPRQGPALPGMEKVGTIAHWVFILAGVATLIGLLVVGAKMALSSSRHHGGDNPNVGALGYVVAGGAIVSVASAVVSVLLA